MWDEVYVRPYQCYPSSYPHILTPPLLLTFAISTLEHLKCYISPCTLGHLRSNCRPALDRYEWRHNTIIKHLLTEFSAQRLEGVELYSNLEGHQVYGVTIPPDVTMTMTWPGHHQQKGRAARGEACGGPLEHKKEPWGCPQEKDWEVWWADKHHQGQRLEVLQPPPRGGHQGPYLN